MKFVTWNVNGLRACLSKGFEDYFISCGADAFCVQETKLQPEQLEFHPEGYIEYISSAEKKGYSGTLIYAKNEPENVYYGIDGKYTDEGRVITLEYDKFFLVNAYVPNAQDGLKRIDYRMKYEDDLREYLLNLDKQKPVVYTGDLNVARSEIDLKNPKSNVGNAGFSDEERGKMEELLSAGFTDSFRYLYPDLTGAYSWWSYRFNARANNAGWRIDYFIVSDRIKDKIKDVVIRSDIYGSDHCPVEIEIKI